jgi:hypothetical protein
MGSGPREIASKGGEAIGIIILLSISFPGKSGEDEASQVMAAYVRSTR